MTFLVLIVIVASAVWVFVDYGTHDWTAGTRFGWVLGTLVLWVVFFPMYLIARQHIPTVKPRREFAMRYRRRG
jgi:hypothetical protein